MNRLLFCFAALTFSFTARAQWTPVSAPNNEDLWGVCYGSTQFVAVGTAGTILTSSYGTTWTAQASGTTAWLTAVCYTPERALYVAVGDHGTILTSPDALVWTARTSGTTQRLNNVTSAVGRFLAVGEAGTVCTSTDAVTWTATTLPLDSWLRGLCYGPDSFLIGAGDGTLCSTEDGTHFRYLGKIQNSNNSLPQSVEALFYTGGLTFAAGSNGGVVYSTDRVHWDPKAGGGSLTYRGLAKSSLYVVAVGTTGATFGAWYDTAYFGPPSYNTVGTANLNALVIGPPGSVTVGDHGTIYLSSSVPLPPTGGTSFGAPATAYVGGTIRLTPGVGIGPTPPLTFQWSRSGQPLVGATAEALVLKDYTTAAAGIYTLTVSNASGSASIDFNAPVPIAPPSSTVDPHFIPQVMAATAATVVPLPNGQFLTTADRLVRFNADGSWDRSFHAAATGKVTPLPGGQLLVQSIYVDTPSVVRLNPDGSLDSNFVASATPGYVTPLADGRFVRIAVSSDNQATVSRLNADGTSDASFAPFAVTLLSPYGAFNYWTYASSTPITALDNQGRVYVAARSFPSRMAGGACCLLRLTPSGDRDDTFAPVAHPDYIASLKIIKGKLCYDTGGDYYAAFPFFNHSFARLNEDGSTDASFPRLSFQNAPPAVMGLAQGTFDADGGLIVTTDDSNLQHPANVVTQGLIRYDATGVRDPSFSARLAAPFTSIASVTLATDGSLIVAGSFTSLNGVPAAGIARVLPITDAYATRLSNLSIRTTAGTGDQSLIAGFVVAGDASASRSVLLRAVGPGLIPLGVNARDILADPQLTLHLGSSTIASNDDWDFALDATATALGAFPLARASKDAALLAPLFPGAYTAHVTASGSATASGLALIELYDADPAPTSASSPRLVNLSGRARVGTGDNVLIAGFVIAGHSTKRVLIRAVGPGLLPQSVTDALLDPELSVNSGAETIAENDNWSSADTSASAVFTTVGAFPLGVGSKDAALVLDLPPGVYTAVVKGMNASTGTALVEIYEVP